MALFRDLVPGYNCIGMVRYVVVIIHSMSLLKGHHQLTGISDKDRKEKLDNRSSERSYLKN